MNKFYFNLYESSTYVLCIMYYGAIGTRGKTQQIKFAEVETAGLYRQAVAYTLRKVFHTQRLGRTWDETLEIK